MQSRAHPLSITSRHTFLAAAAIVLFTVAFSLVLSSRKLFWEDELFEFYSDSRPTIAAVIDGQRHFPFSLEPPAFHLVLHAMQRLPLAPEIATRLPSAVALLGTQISLLVLTLRLTGRRDLALLAMALPFVLGTFYYSAEARAYEALVATYALAFVLYGSALARAGTQRLAAVAGLSLSLAAGVLLHYYGLLLPLPFIVAEAVRFQRRRRIDWPLLAALLLSISAFALNLPFLAGLRDVQAMYFDSGEARWNMVPFTFLWLVDPDRSYRIRAHGGWHASAVSFAILCAFAGLAWLLWRRSRSIPGDTANPFLLLALIAGVLLPVLNIAIGIYKSHAYSPRYSLPVVVPLVALLCLAIAPIFRRRRHTGIALLLILAAGTYQNLRLIHRAVLGTSSLRSSLASSPDLVAATASTKDPRIYIQDLPAFLPAFFYAPPELKARLVNVESVDMEWHWLHSGPASLFSRYMQQSTTVPITTWEQLRLSPGTHLLVLYGASSEWILRELTASGGRATPAGKALGGDLYEINGASAPHPPPAGREDQETDPARSRKPGQGRSL